MAEESLPCPVCNAPISTKELEAHVNRCLDSQMDVKDEKPATPPPTPVKDPMSTHSTSEKNPSGPTTPTKTSDDPKTSKPAPEPSPEKDPEPMKIEKTEPAPTNPTTMKNPFDDPLPPAQSPEDPSDSNPFHQPVNHVTSPTNSPVLYPSKPLEFQPRTSYPSIQEVLDKAKPVEQNQGEKPTVTDTNTTTNTNTSTSTEEDPVNAQMRAYLYWTKKREEEEESLRLAKQLEDEEKQYIETRKKDLEKEETRVKEALQKQENAIKEMQREEEEKKRKLLKDAEDDFMVALKMQQEEEEAQEQARKKKKLEETDADAKFAEDLMKKEQQEDDEKKKRKEWEEALELIKREARMEADEQVARALREKEELEAELLKIRQEMVNNDEGQAVNISLDGVEYPDYWEAQIHNHQEFVLKAGTDEYERIVGNWHNTMGRRCTVVRVTRNQNKTLWMWYFLKKKEITAKNKGTHNEQLLYHGSRANAYEIILKDGFDHRVANLGGAIGAGVYFATNASTSSGYVGGHKHKMFICRVLLGSVGAGAHGLRRPPVKNGSILHDSVGSPGMYVVFDNYQAYPEYCIEYK